MIKSKVFPNFVFCSILPIYQCFKMFYVILKKIIVMYIEQLVNKYYLISFLYFRILSLYNLSYLYLRFNHILYCLYCACSFFYAQNEKKNKCSCFVGHCKLQLHMHNPDRYYKTFETCQFCIQSYHLIFLLGYDKFLSLCNYLLYFRTKIYQKTANIRIAIQSFMIKHKKFCCIKNFTIKKQQICFRKSTVISFKSSVR